MNELKTKVVTKDQFKKILLDQLVNSTKSWTSEDIFKTFLDEGFPKIDFTHLGDSLKKMPCYFYLSPIVVNLEDGKFMWFVSGKDAVLVKVC